MACQDRFVLQDRIDGRHLRTNFFDDRAAQRLRVELAGADWQWGTCWLAALDEHDRGDVGRSGAVG